MNDPNKPLSEYSIEDLAAELARRRSGRGPTTLSEMELEAESLKGDIGSASIEMRLGRLTPEDSRPKPCPRCGRRVRVKAANRERTIRTLSGEHRLVRNYHYCEACQFGFYPRDHLLDLPEQGSFGGGLTEIHLGRSWRSTRGCAAG